MSLQLIKAALQQVRQSTHQLDVLRSTASRTITTRSYAIDASDDDLPAQPRKLDALAESLAAKGYLRAQKPYTPPTDVRGQITTLLADLKLAAGKGLTNLSAADKFAVLNACFATFEHSVPNSHLHEITSVDDIVAFYETPVNTTLPLDALKTMDLPKNLHIQTDYVRFTGNPNDKFGGKTAFPRSSTLVTGLKYRNKYDGHTAKRSWP